MRQRRSVRRVLRSSAIVGPVASLARVSLGCVSLLAALPGCGSDDRDGVPMPPPPGNGAMEPGVQEPGAGEPPPGSAGAGSGDMPGDIDFTGEMPSEPAAPNEPDEPAPGEPLGDGNDIVENLDRGVVAVVQGDGVYVGWRMFGYEYDRERPERITYNVYRDDQLVANVTDSTNYLDQGGNADSEYSVTPVIDGREGPRSSNVAPWGEQFLRVPLESPGAAWTPNDMSVGDVDGDGEYELILKWDPSNAKDNSQAGVTDVVLIDALRLDGTRLWRIDLGPNIRAGAHYTQFIVADGDGDGKAEMMVKTAPGTRDGSGKFLSLGPAAADDDGADFRNGDGYVLSGPEYVTVFDGATGRELATAAFDQARGDVGSWGDNYGNRVDRFLAASAYLDETGLQSFVMARGYYTRSTLTAWNWRDGQLTRLWKFDSDETPRDANDQPFTGQGAHSLSVANVDDDPQQEIVYGSMTVDDDGTGKCSTGRGHGDALHVSDLIPSHPGMEVFMPAEDTTKPFWILRDANTCETIFTSNETGQDVGRAVAEDVLASNPGFEFWASAGVDLSAANTGAVIQGAPQPNSINFTIWWDADETRELENGAAISKLGVGGALLSCQQCSSNNGSKSTPGLVADVLGDWREEIIWRETANTALRIYTTTNLTARRIYTLMHDPQYRVAISWQNVGYNQPPHPSFQIGSDMAAPPTPDIRVLPRPASVPR
jgi:rhamnogalacturonan endolyase